MLAHRASLVNLQSAAFPAEALAVIFLMVSLLVGWLVIFLLHYKKCPADKIMVVYGMCGKNPDGSRCFARCIHGGAVFVWPILQAYCFLDLKPICFEIEQPLLTGELSDECIQNLKDMPTRFTVVISTDKEVMLNAAQRLMASSIQEIKEIAHDIVLGQLRFHASEGFEELSYHFRSKKIHQSIEAELNQIGLTLVNSK